MKETILQHIGIFFRGMAMGAADVVPGVSGGTIAFITGIYEKLLNSIRSFDLELLRVLQKEGIAAAWRRVNGTFLLALFSGILVSILSLAKVLEHLMENEAVLLWSFFFGLIIASVIYIGRTITEWRPTAIAALVFGAGLAYTITLFSPAEGPDAVWFLFLSGCIAICAMILPGISGSFILLLLGSYKHILSAVNDRDIVSLLAFVAGCGIGLLSFSHVLSWMFRNYRNTTLALLTGFMIGSLNKVWPWKHTLTTMIDRHGVEVPVLQENVLPAAFTSLTGEAHQLPIAIGLMLLGGILVLALERLGSGAKATT